MCIAYSTSLLVCVDNIYDWQLSHSFKIITMSKLINTIKLNYYKLLTINIKINNKYKYPLLKVHPKHSHSNYHTLRHKIELINYTK